MYRQLDAKGAMQDVKLLHLPSRGASRIDEGELCIAHHLFDPCFGRVCRLVCPPTSVYATFNRLGGTDKVIMNGVGVGHFGQTNTDDERARQWKLAGTGPAGGVERTAKSKI